VIVKRMCVCSLLLALLLLIVGCAGQGGATTTSPPSIALTTTESTTGTTATAPSTTATTTATTATTVGVSSTTGTSAATGVTAIPGKTYTADLSGKDVVPAVETTATGSASFTVDATGTRIQFVLSVSNITDVIASRVHVGKPGSNGSGVLILYPGPTQSGTFTGSLSGGSFGPSALIGTLADKTIADFVALITSGQAYVNVGTVKNPGGEIRGQIH
jgi:CHRD domain